MGHCDLRLLHLPPQRHPRLMLRRSPLARAHALSPSPSPTRSLSGHGAGPYYTVPFYTLHKLMAGLLDQYHFAGNTQAYEMVQKMAQWVHP